MLHYYEHFKANQAGAEGDHEIPSVEELEERRETGVVAGSEPDESSSEDEEDEEDAASKSEDGGVAVIPAAVEEEPTKTNDSDEMPNKVSRKRKSTEPNEFAFMATYNSKKARMEKAKLAAPVLVPEPEVRAKREKRVKKDHRKMKTSS